MVKLIIFDFDGVIITGSNEGYFRCYHKALREVGVILDPKEERKRILEKWGSGYKKQLEYLLKENPKLLSAAIKAYEHYYHDTNLFLKDIKLIPGVENALRNLTNKYKLALATGMARKTLNNFLDKFDLSFFSISLSIDEVKKDEDRKPSPFMLNKIMSELKTDKDETVYVGDGETDVIMARNAGVIPIVVLSGNLKVEEAEKLGVKYIIPDITKLPELLSKDLLG